MMTKPIYVLSLIILSLVLIANISAYTLKLPVCNDGIVNTSCVNVSDATGTSNTGTPAVIFYQNGNLYVSNDIPLNYTITYVNNNWTNYTNLTQVTQQITNVTYVTYIINNSNGSSFVFQQNYSINNSYIHSLFNEVYASSNYSNFYNRTDSDSRFATKGELPNLAAYLTRGDFEARWATLANLNTLNNLNLTSLNISRINEHLDNGGSGDFNMTWKIIIGVIGIIVLGMAIMMIKSMMDNG